MDTGEGFALHTLSNGIAVRSSELALQPLREEVIAHLRVQITHAARVFPREGTYAQEQFDVHTLMVRVDHVDSRIFEIEPRPMGGGIINRALPQLGADLLQARRRAWRGLRVVVVPSPSRVGSIDDADAGFEIVSLKEAQVRKVLVLPRTLPHETEYYSLRQQSIVPISREWDKSYGLSLGLWVAVHINAVALRMRKGESFVVKSDGTRSEAVHIWHPGDDPEAFLDRIRALSPLYVQDYVPHNHSPFASTIGPDGHSTPWATLHRSFFFYDIVNHCWVHGGSCWVATPTPPVHGTAEMIMGPMYIT